MEDCDAAVKKWEDLDTDVLVKVFESFSLLEITSGIAHVCNAWRMACCDPILWKTLDLSWMKSNFIKVPLEPYVYVNTQSDKLLTCLLKTSLNLSRGCTLTLIFHFNLYVSDDQLTYTAERCPQLKRLVLPAWNRIKKTGMCKAISLWRNLESLTMPSIASPPYYMELISNICKNFRELKIMGPFETIFANALATFLPKLKILSLRCSAVNIDALIIIIDGLQSLKVLNISHCLFVKTLPPPAPKRYILKLDESIFKKASHIREFITCMDDSCIMCQRTRNDDGLLRWYKYEDGLWKNDEVRSLAI